MIGFANTTAVYRGQVSYHQFLSTDPGCGGQTVKGMLGFVSTVQTQNLQPLYRINNSGDYLEDTNTDERASAGYSVEKRQASRRSCTDTPV